MISKKMQKVCLLTLVLVFACCFFMIERADAQKAIPFKFGFVSNAKLQGGQYGALVEKYVNEACKGRIEAKFFPSALLGTDPEMMDKTKIGLIHGFSFECLWQCRALCGCVDASFSFQQLGQGIQVC